MSRAALILLVLVILWAPDAALGQGVFWAHDLRHHHMPWRLWVSQEWLAGRVPLWADGAASGFPLLADGQAGAFYLPTVLLFALLPPALAMNAALLLHWWWAGLGTFALLRAQGRTESAALLGAVAVAFSGVLATHALYLGMLCAVAWLPWALWAVQTRRMALAGVGAWLMMVAGHPQAAAFSMLLLGTVAAHDAWQRRQLPWAFTAAMLLALLAASPQLVATLELTRFSMRDGGVSGAFAGIGSLPPQELISGVLPYFFGYDRPADIDQSYYHRGTGYWGAGENHWEMAFYLGIPTAFLLLWRLRAREERLWVGILLASLLLMLGRHTPAWPLLRLLPGLDGFRFPVRFSLLATVAAAILAAAGAEHLLRQTPDAPQLARARTTALALASVLLLGMGGARLALHLGAPLAQDALTDFFMAQTALPPPPADLPPLLAAALPAPEPEDPAAIPAKVAHILAELARSTSPLSPRVLGPLLLLLAIAGVLHLRTRARLSADQAILALTVLLYADLWAFGADYQARSPRALVEAEPAALSVITAEPGWGRVTVLDRRQDPALDVELMSASLGMRYGLRDVILTSPLLMLRNDALLGLAGLDVGDRGAVKVERLLANPQVPDLLGIRWLLTVHEIPGTDYQEVPLAAEGVRLYRNPDPLPNAFVVGCVQQPEAVWDAMKAIDPRQYAIVEEDVPGVPRCLTGGAGAGTAEVVRASPQEVEIVAEVARPGLLVHTDSLYPGWEATVDGEPAPLVRADLIYRGVALAAGQHTIVLRYRPRGVGMALWLSPLGLLGLLGWAWTRR